MSETRSKPWVGYMSTFVGAHGGGILNAVPTALCTVPVVVTTLLPDDPRPGETWLDLDGNPITVGSVYYDHLHECMYVNGPECGDVRFDDLRRPPVMKTFRLRSAVTTIKYISAESKEAALAMLAESLEEVP